MDVVTPKPYINIKLFIQIRHYLARREHLSENEQEEVSDECLTKVHGEDRQTWKLPYTLACEATTGYKDRLDECGRRVKAESGLRERCLRWLRLPAVVSTTSVRCEAILTRRRGQHFITAHKASRNTWKGGTVKSRRRAREKRVDGTNIVDKRKTMASKHTNTTTTTTAQEVGTVVPDRAFPAVVLKTPTSLLRDDALVTYAECSKCQELVN